MTTLLWILVTLALAWGLAYHRVPGWIWSVATLALAVVTVSVIPALSVLLWIAFAISLALNLASVRSMLISEPLLRWFKKMLPQVSQTEREALDAGTVWWDGDLFSGKPDWRKLLAVPKPQLTPEEQAFLGGPVEQLCAMLDEWRITHELYDMPPEVWQFIKDQGFFGMIIPKQYGGKGFSALAHSAVITKLASRSGTATVSVMVPNSLGPAELLLNYGTEEQKKHYLPRLACGQEIPCFALTGPEAGSDAGSIPDYGVVCRGEFQGGQDVLGMRVTWEKRYITLGPVATLLGLAFKLYDPERLLGGNEEVGITLALIPTHTPGVNIGRRHFPLNAAFQNGPNSGKDVFIPMEWVIGGVERVGQGWRMLMNCLAAGRSISLPASSTGMAKLAARATGAYSRVRIQFNTPIGKFEGVEEALARIGGNTYMMDAARVMTACAVDLGEKPSVISAIVKYHLTERGRQVINDAMDVHGGKGICMGPGNYLARAYQQLPVGITVEGANILTRSMIIFGQGAIRCHPYVLQEIASANNAETEKALREFDAALFGHIRFTLSNAARALFLGLTGARLAGIPGAPDTARYFRQLARLSSAFALLADVAMLVLGGALKRKEKLSARLGDVLSLLYLSSAVLKRYEDEGRQRADLPLLHWSLQDALWRMQGAIDGILENFPGKGKAWLLRRIVFPLGKTFSPPSDELGRQVSSLLLAPSATRDRLTAGIYVPVNEADPVGRLDIALQCALVAEAIEAKIRDAVKDRRIKGKTFEETTAQAVQQGIISAAEMEMLAKARALRREVIMVDDFPPDFGKIVPAKDLAAQREMLSSGRKTA